VFMRSNKSDNRIVVPDLTFRFSTFDIQLQPFPRYSCSHYHEVAFIEYVSATVLENHNSSVVLIIHLKVGFTFPPKGSAFTS
jgi:hypothetical protein